MGRSALPAPLGRPAAARGAGTSDRSGPAAGGGRFAGLGEGFLAVLADRAALVGIGALIAQGGLSFWPIWIAGSVGAALGDWLSYWIGRKLEYGVQKIWPLSRYPELIPKGEAFVRTWGVYAIFIGRFFGP